MPTIQSEHGYGTTSGMSRLKRGFEMISILILGLLINVLIVINGDKIINFFTNKYIKLYVKWNMKLIGLEVFGLGASILYFMYNLSMGIRFIATHPITGL